MDWFSIVRFVLNLRHSDLSYNIYLGNTAPSSDSYQLFHVTKHPETLELCQRETKQEEQTLYVQNKVL